MDFEHFYRVISFHINIDAGDAAIHILYYKPAGATQPIVERAIFIDGGKSEHSTYRASIGRTIDHIEANYTCQAVHPSYPQRTYLVFDAFVVSHFDSDHCEGLLQFILQDREEDVNIHNLKNLPVDQARLSRAKYDDNRNPLSYFFAPNWGSPRENSGLPNHSKVGKWRTDYNYEFKRSTNENYVDIKKSGSLFSWMSVLKLKVGKAALLGRNFFNPDVENFDEKTITSITDLLEKNPPVSKKHPGMYCLGVNQWLLGNNVQLTHTLANMSSICNMIIWPTENKKEHFSHYFSGDADIDFERRLLDWIWNDRNNRDQIRVTSMKLSHHGAFTSTPVEMLQYFNPSNVIVSAGTHRGYGHPRWEVVAMIDEWSKSAPIRLNRYRSPPFFPTQYPYYLVRDERNRYDPGSWKTTEINNKKFQAFLQDLANAINWDRVRNDCRELASLVDDYADAVNNNNGRNLSPTAATNLILDHIELALKRISGIPPAATALNGGGRVGGTNARAALDKQIMFVGVISGSEDDRIDGVVKVRSGLSTKTFMNNVKFERSQGQADAGEVSEFRISESRTYIKYDMIQPPKFATAAGKKIRPFKTLGAGYVGIRDMTNRPSGVGSNQEDEESQAGDIMDDWYDLENPDHDSDLCTRTLPSNELIRTVGHSLPGQCYIVLDEDRPSPDSSTLQVSKGHSLYTFIQCLHHELIQLSTNPVKKTATPLAESDEWQKWFQTLHDIKDETNKSQILLTVDEVPIADTSVIDFHALLNVAGRQLKFTTQKAGKTLGGISGDALKQMLVNRIRMAFGLDKGTSPFSTTLKDMSAFIGLKNPVLKVLGVLPLELDQSERTRNMLWFTPSMNYETVTRLQFKASTNLLRDWLRDTLPDFDLPTLAIIAKRRALCEMTAGGDGAVVIGEMSFVLDIVIKDIKLQGVLSFESDDISLTIQNNERKDILKPLVEWLARKLGADNLPIENWLGSSAEVIDTSSVIPRRLEICIASDPETGKLQRINSILMSLEAGLQVGKSKEQSSKPLVFLFEFGWSFETGPRLRAGLWSAPTPLPGDVYQKALPEWEEHLVFEPVTDMTNNRLGTLDLRTILPDEIKNIPSGIPTEIVRSAIEINGNGISFEGTLRCSEPKTSNVPKLRLDTLDLNAGYKWAKANRGVFFSLGVDVLLFPGGDENKELDLGEQDTARMSGKIGYQNGNWALAASISNLSVAHIASFWEPDIRGGVMELLGQIRIESLDLKYNYGASGTATDFLFEGRLLISKLYFDFNYENSGEKWHFKSSLGIQVEKDAVTVGQLLGDIIGTEALLDVPDAITSIELATPDDKEIFRLACFQQETYVCFMTTIRIGKITFSFMQLRDKNWDKTRKSKRIIKAAISEIKPVDVPMFGPLKQPFDQMYYMWVSDDNPSEKNMKNLGITESEFNILSQAPDLKPADQLFYKSTKAKYEANEAVIPAGHHFVVVTKDSAGKQKVVIDYVFGKPKPKAGSTSTFSSNDLVLYSGEAAGGENEKAAFKKTVGPLTIDSIGLYYKNKRVGITFDATFMMGPIGLSLLGFSIHMPFDKNTLTKVPSDVGFSLDGLLVSFDRPPLTIAGGFMRTEQDGIKCFAGGIIIAFKPWSFQAVGVYATVPKSNTRAITDLDEIDADENCNALDEYVAGGDTYTMVFVFCKLNGPLFSVGFADVSGLTGGVGVNSDIGLPTVEQVVDFPFIKPGGSGSKEDFTLTTLKTLMKGVWFRPSEGSFWVAAGAKVTAFQMMSIDAVIVVQFAPDVKLGIYGVAIIDAPSIMSPVKFAHVELGIACTYDIQAGIFKLEAQLSPRSFVLHPSCHLTGGFALFAWTKDGQEATAGDWVVTIGGYHQAFSVPSQYPRPPRLGISWALGPLRITGEAYFAVTPKVCMGGGRLHASLKAGPLEAFFDAYIDFLINYQPFHFTASGGLSIGVRFKLDLWIVTIRISVEIGATLYLEGPPFGGIVHVDFCVFGFDIKFGDKSRKPPPLDLDNFWNLAIKSTGSPSAALLAPANDVDPEAKKETAHLISCQSGLEPQEKKETEQNAPWIVHGAAFSFLVSFHFAINSGTMQQILGGEKTELQTIPIEKENQKIYARPMQLAESLDSIATVRIEQKLEDQQASRSDHVSILAWKDRKWSVTPVVKNVQQSIWGQYDPRFDASRAGNRSSDLLSTKDSSRPLVMGLTIKPPPPEMADDTIAPFNVVEDMREDVFADKPVKERPMFPTTEKADPAYAPSADVKEPSWKEIRDEWEKKENQPEKAVDIWAKALGFEGKIKGARPTRLLSRLESMVPAKPVIAVGGA